MAITGLDAHQQPLLGVEVDLERPAVGGVISSSAQGSPLRSRILCTRPTAPGARSPLRNLRPTRRPGRSCGRGHHAHDQHRENAEQRQQLGEREQHPDLGRQRKPADAVSAHEQRAMTAITRNRCGRTTKTVVLRGQPLPPH